MSIAQLDYEETLAALQAFVGTRVAVSIANRESEYQGANIVGPLHSGAEIDLGAQVPELEGDFAGESILFRVVDPAQPVVHASFTIWRDGFEWGRRVQRPHGYTITFSVAGLTIRVRPAPPGV